MQRWFYTVPLRLRSLFRRRQVEQDLDDELQYHLERKTEEVHAQGLTPEKARRAALQAMDGLTQRKAGVPGSAAGERHPEHASGCPLRLANSVKVSRLYDDRRADAG